MKLDELFKKKLIPLRKTLHIIGVEDNVVSAEFNCTWRKPKG
jgi:hypothetical protein